jgi:hypothetical protein
VTLTHDLLAAKHITALRYCLCYFLLDSMSFRPKISKPSAALLPSYLISVDPYFGGVSTLLHAGLEAITALLPDCY